MVNRYEKARKVRPRNRSVPGARVPNPAETLTPAGPPNSGSYCDSTAAGRTSAWGPTLSSGPIPSKGDDVAHHRAGGPDRPPRHPRPDRPEQAPQRGARRARRVNARGARRRSHRGHRRAGAVRRLRPAPFRGDGRRAARPRSGAGAHRRRARSRPSSRRAHRVPAHRDGRTVLPEARLPSRPAHRRRPGRPRVDGVHDRVPGERAGDGSAVALVLQPRLLRKSLRRGLLLRGEVLGDFDSHLHVLVAAPAVLLDPLPRDAESLAVLRAGRHLEHHALPVQRPHLDPGAEHRLREVDRHHTRDVEASALAPEKPVRLDVDHDDDVAAPPCALALQPEPRAVVGAGRNVDHQALVDLHVPRALTRGAALRRDLPAAAAHRTGPRHREAALAERDRAAAPALETGRERCTQRAAAPPAGGAHFRHPERHRHLAPQRRDAERDRDRGLDLLFFLPYGAALAAAAEDRREDVAQPAERAEIGEIEISTLEGPPPTRPRARVRAVAPQLIVLPPLLSVAQDVVRLVDLLEALGRLRRAGAAAWMVLLGEPAKRLLDLIRRRRLRDAEDLVIVLGRRHQAASPCHVSTTTRAGRISTPPSR